MKDELLQKSKFLIVDDEPSNVRLLEQNLQMWNCPQVSSTTDSREVVHLFNTFQPDIILLDLLMPHLDGFGVLENLRQVIAPDSYLPILVLTADINPKAKKRALASGAKDFLTKPFDSSELLLRIWNLLETRYLYLQLEDQNRLLNEGQIEVIDRLARAASLCDDEELEPDHHTDRVARNSGLLAQALGVESHKAQLIQRAAPLHDVGKIGLGDGMLWKPSRLTADEFEIMKSHTLIGAAMLAGGKSTVVQIAESIALTHHEKWDGSGYPRGLAGDAIPEEGRIVAIADVFDALTHNRPQRPAWSVDEAVAEMQAQRGLHFEPRMVDAFLELPRQFLVK